jgi:two-component system KDP operon response regulator KdpE
VTRVLIVEDDAALRRSLVLGVTARGYDVDETGNGEDALKIAGRTLPDIVLLDLGLPGISGLDVIRGIRNWSSMPIIVLSARGAEGDKVQALDLGANDYVTKPFGVEELLARLRVAERQIEPAEAVVGRVITADFSVDADDRTVVRSDGQHRRLTPIEWALLAHLVANEPHTVSQTDLLQAVWGERYLTETNYLRVHLTHLRQKIEPDAAAPRYVLTQPGVGYRFDSSGGAGR